MADTEREKQLAAEAAAQLVEAGMTVGLGTGTTAAYVLGPLASRRLAIRCVATSPAIGRQAARLGLEVVDFARGAAPSQLDLAIDGADQAEPSGWLIKGGGGAHTREKVVAAAASRFVVIVSSNKLVERLSPPIPLELAPFGLASTVARLGAARLRGAPPSPDGGVLADYFGAVEDPEGLAARLSATPGVVEHGLFPASMVADIIVGRGDGVERIRVDRRTAARGRAFPSRRAGP